MKYFSHTGLSLVLTIGVLTQIFVHQAVRVYAAPEGDDAKMAWHDEAGKYSELRLGDRPVLRYINRPLDESTEQSRYETYKVFHHLFDPAGNQLVTGGPTGTEEYSKDVKYPHHRGIFYGFNRITYGDGQKADTWHCNNGESQQHASFQSVFSGSWKKDPFNGKDTNVPFSSHELAIDWIGSDGKVFAKEKRTVGATVRPNGTLVNFGSTLESAAGGTIHLDGDPQHAGFQFRSTPEVAANDADKTYYLRTDGKGKLSETRNWDHKNADSPQNAECTNRPWNAMSFVVGGTRYTALYLDHPDNPKPSRYSERDYGRFGSYFVADVTPEKPLTVRYQLWLQEGEMTVEQCEAMSQEFVKYRFADNVPPPGFEVLFNGKDLTGWKGLVGNPKTRAAETSEEKRATDQATADALMREHWSAVDGALVYDSAKEGSNICTAKDYANFELLMDWKIESGGDSGIYLRGSPQVQIWDTAHEPFFKNGADKGSGSLWNNSKHERFPLVKADKPAGEWNKFYIKMVGEKATIKLNGELVVDDVVLENYWQRDQPVYPTGQIELQKHDGVLWFKNIYIRELP